MKSGTVTTVIVALVAVILTLAIQWLEPDVALSPSEYTLAVLGAVVVVVPSRIWWQRRSSRTPGEEART
jgi:hypothetical protein